MSRYNIVFGKLAEDAACLFLRKEGYKILERNYKTRYGEIDIIAQDAETLCFIEIKSRSSLAFGYPQESVSRSKQKKIIQSALTYLKTKKLLEANSRFDVLGMIHPGSGRRQSFELIKDAFSLSEGYSY